VIYCGYDVFINTEVELKQLAFALPDIGPEEIDNVVSCLRSGWLTSGKMVQQFEREFADYVGAKEAVSVSSATMAALLLLSALEVGPGDEVIVPAYTFSGPAMMAHKLGAKIVFADCAPNSYQIDPEHVASLITPRTKVIMPTHFAGSACDIAALAKLCVGRGIHLIDDAAHAFPTFDATTDTMVGQGVHTAATFFSFYATKTLTTGEGGMVTTNDEVLARKVRNVRSHGFSREAFDRYTNLTTSWRYDIAHEGWKANMTDLAAAIGLAQLKRSDTLQFDRASIAKKYRQELRELPIGLPEYDKHSAWHLFPIQVEKRDEFISLMAQRGVQCSVHFIPLHHHTKWQAIVGPQSLPNSDAMFAKEVSLPIFSRMTTDDIDRVVVSAHEVLKELKLC
jgi:dTDP-4-amino-4,6-dideoxygalactose transaminase